MVYSQPGEEIFVQGVGGDYVFDVVAIVSPLGEFVVEHGDFVGELGEVMVMGEPAHFQFESVEEGVKVFGFDGEVFDL